MFARFTWILLVDCPRINEYISAMSASSDPIQEILGPSGTLARSLKNFEFRHSQVGMAHLIRDVLEENTVGLVEAGTGTGKTLSYLLPIVLSGKKAVISTGTKNLQDQILFKDIPLLSDSTGLSIDAMLMKGRKNYLCLHKYFQYRSQPSLLASDQEKTTARIDAWLRKTEFADRSELFWLKDDDPLWEALSSTSEQCLGINCPHAEDCYLNALRRKAARSRIIIVNHHLFFADLMVKEGGFGEIIPRFQIVVFDEAHKIEEIATTYFGESLSTAQLISLVNEVEKEAGELRKIRKKDLDQHLNSIRTGTESLKELILDRPEKSRIDDDTLATIDRGFASNVRKGLSYIQHESGLDLLQNGSPHTLVTRASELEQKLERIFLSDASNWLCWYEKRKKAIVLHKSPLDISQYMQELVYHKGKAVVFTSATLSTNGNFDYIRSRLGLLEEVTEGIYPSHFDFSEQTILYVPKDLPPPGDPEFGAKAGMRILNTLKCTAGRALVLFTSFQNLYRVHRIVRGKIPYNIWKQGDAPKSVLLKEFTKDTHSVLLATGSFWQGVDVPGEALSCLIIDKLPFDSPGDPLIAARLESIRSRGGNPFMEYQLPSAIISLKQGLGRLIRNSADRGILAIMDSRMITRSYGRFFFESLPEIPLTHELSDVESFFGHRDKPESVFTVTPS